MDSIADVTGELTMDYELILTMSEGWGELLRSYDITWAVVETYTPLATTRIQK